MGFVPIARPWGTQRTCSDRGHSTRPAALPNPLRVPSLPRACPARLRSNARGRDRPQNIGPRGGSFGSLTVECERAERPQSSGTGATGGPVKRSSKVSAPSCAGKTSRSFLRFQACSTHGRELAPPACEGAPEGPTRRFSSVTGRCSQPSHPTGDPPVTDCHPPRPPEIGPWGVWTGGKLGGVYPTGEEASEAACKLGKAPGGAWYWVGRLRSARPTESQLSGGKR